MLNWLIKLIIWLINNISLRYYIGFIFGIMVTSTIFKLASEKKFIIGTLILSILIVVTLLKISEEI